MIKKDWSAVKKGAMIGGLTGLILPITLITLLLTNCSSIICLQIFYSSLSLAFPLLFVIRAVTGLFASDILIIISLLLEIPIYIGIGTLIGWVIQKIKR